ncbi:hypothetical protein A6R75_23650 [Pseudomonas aeruginosa]|nr:hypothetical protein A6R75_23650 [Pseudomonas aeruginosa]
MHDNSTATAQVIPFRQKELLLVGNAGEPFVPMKPVVEGMGLAWQSQHRKLQSGRFATCITEMVIQLPGTPSVVQFPASRSASSPAG